MLRLRVDGLGTCDACAAARGLLFVQRTAICLDGRDFLTTDRYIGFVWVRLWLLGVLREIRKAEADELMSSPYQVSVGYARHLTAHKRLKNDSLGSWRVEF